MPILQNSVAKDKQGVNVAPNKQYIEPEFIDCTISGTGKVTISKLGDEIVSKKLKGFRDYTHIDYYKLKEQN